MDLIYTDSEIRNALTSFTGLGESESTIAWFVRKAIKNNISLLDVRVNIPKDLNEMDESEVVGLFHLRLREVFMSGHRSFTLPPDEVLRVIARLPKLADLH